LQASAAAQEGPRSRRQKVYSHKLRYLDLVIAFPNPTEKPSIGRTAMKTRSVIALALVAGAALGATAVQTLHAQSKPPAYVVTATDISDLDQYRTEYVPAAQASIRASGGRILAASQNIVARDGPPPGVRVAINAFDSLEAVQAWRDSAAFKEARKIGDKYAKFRAFAVEGVPQ
jgi:uncharacterized protein (DUF1330 family)